MNRLDDPRAPRLYAELVPLLRNSPGGVLKSEVRAMMDRHGYSHGYNVEPIIAHLPPDCPVWEQKDNEDKKEIWYRLCRPTDTTRRPAKMSQPKKTGAEKDPQVAVSPATMRRLKHWIADHGGSQKDIVDTALARWLDEKEKGK